jgi:hypothetical protein
MISKISYHIHTDAIEENLIPKTLTKEQVAIMQMKSLLNSNSAKYLNSTKSD